MTDNPRQSFAHQDVATLVTAYAKGGIDAALTAFPDMPRARIEAKLEELGVVRISPAGQTLVTQFVGEIRKQENAPLVARYAIRALREYLSTLVDRKEKNG